MDGGPEHINTTDNDIIPLKQRWWDELRPVVSARKKVRAKSRAVCR